MKQVLLVTLLVFCSIGAFAADKPDTVTQYPARIDTLRFDRINGVWKAITDTVWAQKIQVWLTPDQYKRLLELLAPPKPWSLGNGLWIECADSIISPTRIQLDTLSSVWLGDCNK